MTIPQVALTSAMTYQPSYNDNQQQNNQPLLPTTIEVSPEQKNSLQDNVNARLVEQVENVKSNYQTARDMDLTRLYYEQQQKVIEAYMYSNDNTVNSDKNDNRSVTGSLTELYASLYELHQAVKTGEQQLPYDETQLPVIQPIPLSENITQAQTDKYNSIMMPSNTSHIYLSA